MQVLDIIDMETCVFKRILCDGIPLDDRERRFDRVEEAHRPGDARLHDFRKLDFHFNASLAAVNLAKAACKRLGITYSISSCKSFIHNAYMLE